MENREEILKALETIKSVCKSQPNCNGCPLSDKNGYCGVQDIEPEKWCIRYGETKWYAFED